MMNTEIAFILYGKNNIFLGMLAFASMGDEFTMVGEILLSITSIIAVFGVPIVLEIMNQCHCQS